MPMRSRHALAALTCLTLAALALALALAACRGAPDAPATEPTGHTSMAVTVNSASAPGLAPGAGNGALAAGALARTPLDALAALPIKGRASKTGYTRGQFGLPWVDVDHNGCDTRDDVLRRDLRGVTLDPDGCTVRAGQLADPYTGKTIIFQRGQDTSRAVQIDHVVALSDAWQTGAQQLDGATRTALANDPLNLLAVDGPTNEAKGDGDFATWRPPVRTYWCQYAARITAVKAKYRLWTTAAEHDAMALTLATCPDQPLPAEAA